MFRRLTVIMLSSLLMVVITACGQRETTGSTANATTAAGSTSADGGAASTTTMMPIDHDGMAMDETATSIPMDDDDMMMDETTTTMDGMTTGVPFDAQFIDNMIEHHTSAIAMAEQALTEAERPEIKQLAQNVIRSQQQEIEQMNAWRAEWYPAQPPTTGMGMSMGDMEISDDTSQPFDQRFITAMIAHHNGAIAMAKEAQNKAEHAEIEQLADAIITAQESEVSQMQQWQREWFGREE